MKNMIYKCFLTYKNYIIDNDITLTKIEHNQINKLMNLLESFGFELVIYKVFKEEYEYFVKEFSVIKVGVSCPCERMRSVRIRTNCQASHSNIICMLKEIQTYNEGKFELDWIEFKRDR